MVERDPTHCVRHPRVESRLACGKCGDFICPQCMVHTPVGVRCPECANVRKLPTYQRDTSTYLRAVGAGVVLAGVLGAVWGFLFFEIIRIPFLPWAATVGVGFLIGEGISASVNRKRGRDLQYIAGACMALSYVVAGFVSPLVFVFTFPNLFFLLILVIAIFVAAGRVG